MKQRTKVLLASTLKPVDDTRMFEKFAIPLSQTSKYAINIIGFSRKSLPSVNNIQFHPIFSFSRMGLKRLWAPWKAFRYFWNIKPKILIVHTHELLLPAVLYKCFFSCHLVYDIQENYFLNLWHARHYPFGIKHLLAWYVRGKEWLLSQWVKAFILAEQSYETEIHYLRNNAIVLENKFQFAYAINSGVRNFSDSDNLGFIYSGTISENYGIFKIVALIKELHRLDSRVHLTIVGHCPHSATLQKLYDEINGIPFISLIGGPSLVPHTEIIRLLSQHNMGIIAYDTTDRSLQNCFPTRIFEYLALEIPFILPNYDPWVRRIASFQASIPYDFDNPNPEVLLKAIKSQNFYPNGAPEEAFWAPEAKKLLQLIDELS